jgi:hypothetical protein
MPPVKIPMGRLNFEPRMEREKLLPAVSARLVHIPAKITGKRLISMRGSDIIFPSLKDPLDGCGDCTCMGRGKIDRFLPLAGLSRFAEM